MALGERAAQHSGVNVERLRGVAIAATALLTGAAVAHAGIIAFVGLIIPHLLRLILGPSNRLLLPASALGGALLIALSDLGARTLIPVSDLPIGILRRSWAALRSSSCCAVRWGREVSDAYC